MGGVSSAEREAALWEMEEHQLQERHQLVKQQLKDQYFLQRHDLLRKHEKVRPGWDAGQLHDGTREGGAAVTGSWVPCSGGRNQGSRVRAADDADGSSAHPNASVLDSVSSKPVLGCLKLCPTPTPQKRGRTERGDAY